jgi:hypothetical protein
MDFNDINSRLKRIYSAIGKQTEHDVSSNVKQVFEKSGDEYGVGVVFGKRDETELQNIAFGIINTIASLKDHLKTKIKANGGNPKSVENMINGSIELMLIMDLWNQDKHGYPLTKNNRSKKNPRVVNFTQGLTMSGGTQATVTFKVTPAGINHVSSTENTVIKINAEIVDEHGTLIMPLDKMIDASVIIIENFVSDNKLN